MTKPRLYADEDSMDEDVVDALRARGVDVRTVSDDGMRGRSDRVSQRLSSRQGVLYRRLDPIQFS